MATLTIGRRQALQGLGGLTLAAAAWQPGRAASKTLRARSYADLQVLDPLDWVSQPDADIAACCLNKLIRHKPGTSWDWEPDAAEEVKQVDDTHIHFRLKPGQRWSGGFGEITADDVKFSFERIADPANKSPYAEDWSALDHVDVHGPHEGTIVLKQYFAPLWTSTLPEASGQIVCRKAVEALPGKRFTTSFPAVSGPYRLAQWVPKQKTVLARNPDWSGPAPAFDAIEILPIEDVKSAEIAFDAGDIDYTWISLDGLAKYKKTPPAHAALVERPSLAFTWMGINTQHPNFTDQRVRRAVQQAVDMGAVLDAAYFGQAQRATGIIAPSLLGHREKNLYAYDPAASKRLLAEAGKSGLATTISCLNTTERTSAAQVIQANLADVGIQAQIKPYDSGTFWTLGDQKKGNGWKELQIFISRFTMEPDPSWATAWFTPQQIGVWNWERWNSPEYGKLNAAALLERDDAKRSAMYRHMQDLMEESGAYTFITNGATPSIVRAGIRPALLPDGRPLLWEFALG